MVTDAGDAAYFALLRENVGAISASIMPLVIVLAHLDDLQVDERQQLLNHYQQNYQQQLNELNAIPPHDGAAAAAFELMRSHMAADLAAIESLLGESA